MLASCGGPAPAPHPQQQPTSCSSFDASLASAKELEAAGRLDRAIRVVHAAVATCAERARGDARVVELRMLLEGGRFDEARVLAKQIEADPSATDEERRALSLVPQPKSADELQAPLMDLSELEALFRAGDPVAVLARADAIWTDQPWHARAALLGALAARKLKDVRKAQVRFDRALFAFETKYGQAEAVQLTLGEGVDPVTSAVIEPASAEATFLQTSFAGEVMLERSGDVLAQDDRLAILVGGMVVDKNGRRLGQLPALDTFQIVGGFIVGWNASSTVVFDTKLHEVGRRAEALREGVTLSTDDAKTMLFESTESSVRISALPSLELRLDVAGARVWTFPKQMRAAVMGFEPPEGAFANAALDVYDIATGRRLVRSPMGQYGIGFSWLPELAMDAEGKRVVWSTFETIVLDLRTGKQVVLESGIDLGGGDPYAQPVGHLFAADGKHVCLSQWGERRVVPNVKVAPGTTLHCFEIGNRGVVQHLALEPGWTRVRRTVGHNARVYPEAVSPSGKLVAVVDVEGTPGAASYPFPGGHARVSVFQLGKQNPISTIDLGQTESTSGLELRIAADDSTVSVSILGSDSSGTFNIATAEKVAPPLPLFFEDPEPPKVSSLGPPAARITTKLARGRVLSSRRNGSDVGFGYWDLPSGRLLASGPAEVCQTAISPSGATIAVGLCDPDSFTRASVRVMKPDGSFTPELKVWEQVAVSDTGRIVWGGGRVQVADFQSPSWIVRELATRSSSAIEISPAGHHALVEYGGDRRLVQLDTGESGPTLPRVGGLTRFVDDQSFVSGGKVHPIEKTTSVAFVPVSTQKAGSGKVEVTLANGAASSRTISLSAPPADDCTSFNNHELLAISDGYGAVRIFSIDDAAIRATFVPTGTASALMFGADGTVARLGSTPGVDERLFCKVGDLLVPFDVCKDRYFLPSPAPLKALQTPHVSTD